MFFSLLLLNFFSGTMKLTVSLFGFVLYTQVVDSQLVGYVGKNITLPSGADPSWTLEKVEWSIYANTTWIATRRGATERINRVARYRNRLSLNASSGDLTIHRLSLSDAKEYSVDLTNERGENNVKKIKLVVKQPLEKPDITQRQWFTGQICVVALRCQSWVRDAELSWDTTSVNGETRTIDGPDGSFLFIRTTQESNEVTCTSRREKDEASSVFQAVCDGKNTVTSAKPTSPTNPTTPAINQPCPRGRLGLCFFGGFFLGAGLMALLLTCFRGRLPPPGKCLPGWSCSKTSM